MLVRLKRDLDLLADDLGELFLGCDVVSKTAHCWPTATRTSESEVLVGFFRLSCHAHVRTRSSLQDLAVLQLRDALLAAASLKPPIFPATISCCRRHTECANHICVALIASHSVLTVFLRLYPPFSHLTSHLSHLTPLIKMRFY